LIDWLIDWLPTDGSTETVDELLITADVRTCDEPSIDEFISRVEGTKVYGMDDVLSHHAERRRQAGMNVVLQIWLDVDLFLFVEIRAYCLNVRHNSWVTSLESCDNSDIDIDGDILHCGVLTISSISGL